MRRTIFTVVAAAAMTVGLALCVQAEGIGRPYVGMKDAPVVTTYSWTGAYGGLGGGYQIGANDLTATAPGFAASINGLSSRDWVGDGRVGFDYQVGNSPFVVGLLAGYSTGKGRFDANVNTFTLNAELDKSWYAGGRVGLVFHRYTLVYVGYAYTQADLSISSSVPGVCATALNCAHDLKGHQFLLGTETAIAPNFTVGPEFAYTRFDTAPLSRMPGVNLGLEPDAYEFKVRINWRPMAGMFGN